jgi:hypothetical protein
MRRVQATFTWEIDMWKTRADDARNRGGDNQEGQVSYALRQAAIRESMLAHCTDVWVDAFELLRS